MSESLMRVSQAISRASQSTDSYVRTDVRTDEEGSDLPVGIPYVRYAHDAREAIITGRGAPLSFDQRRRMTLTAISLLSPLNVGGPR